jgi:hypothetical protein
MPTPIVYGPNLYTCPNSGVLACYLARTGREVYKARMRSKAKLARLALAKQQTRQGDAARKSCARAFRNVRVPFSRPLFSSLKRVGPQKVGRARASPHALPFLTSRQTIWLGSRRKRRP